MPFRWIVALTLWTLLSGPILVQPALQLQSWATLVQHWLVAEDRPTPR